MGQPIVRIMGFKFPCPKIDSSILEVQKVLMPVKNLEITSRLLLGKFDGCFEVGYVLSSEKTGILMLTACVL